MGGGLHSHEEAIGFCVKQRGTVSDFCGNDSHKSIYHDRNSLEVYRHLAGCFGDFRYRYSICWKT